VTRGLLLFAHGARDPRWSQPFEAVAAQVQGADATLAVELAYLEYMAPTLREAGERLAARGCSRVDVVPLFLGAGGHVRQDLPALLGELAALHPQTQWRLRPAVGETPSVIAAMARAALDWVEAPPAPRA
jgi:sirohydrochlorin cobaltochelatase